ncbi:MAG: F0F1 ATP synthase subunit epsilon [Clostridia bacterium]|nr:F0F1 ATP synthase subunit epsilon [Clostridia bacterium]MBQ9924423.1 F0F1 ATP synthase subunit epsilon [Clostridia bacterium]
MKAFKLQIVTPEGMFYDGECTRISVKTTEGGVTILPGHIPYVTTLAKDGWCRVDTENGRRKAYCSGGMMTVTQEITRVVAASFKWEE